MACTFCKEDGHNISKCTLPSKPCKIDISRTSRSKPATRKQISRTVTQTAQHCVAYCIGVTGNPSKTASNPSIKANFRELRTIWCSRASESISETLAKETDKRSKDKKFQSLGVTNLDKSPEGFLYLFIAFR